MLHVADDCLPAFIDRDVFNRDFLLPAGPVSLQRIHLRGEGAARTARDDEGAIGPWGGLTGTIFLIEYGNNPSDFGKTDTILPIRIR